MMVRMEEGRKLYPKKEEANFFDHLMRIPCAIELDEEERFPIRDVDL